MSEKQAANRDVMAEKTRELTDILIQSCIEFGRHGFPLGTDYKQSHDATLSAIMMTIGRVVAGTPSDVEDVLQIVVDHFRSKQFRKYIANEREKFIKLLADSGKEFRHGKPNDIGKSGSNGAPND